MIEVEIEGLKEAAEAFTKLGTIGEKHLSIAMQEMAAEGVSAMRLACPVQTNRLRSSLHYETPDSRSYVYSDQQGQSFRGAFTEKARRLEVIYGTNVEYADSVNEYSRTGKGYLEEGAKQIEQIKDRRMTVNFQNAIDEALGR